MEYTGTKRSSDHIFQRSKHFSKRQKLNVNSNGNGILVSPVNPRKMNSAVKEVLNYLKIYYSKDSNYTQRIKKEEEPIKTKEESVNTITENSEHLGKNEQYEQKEPSEKTKIIKIENYVQQKEESEKQVEREQQEEESRESLKSEQQKEESEESVENEHQGAVLVKQENYIQQKKKSEEKVAENKTVAFTNIEKQLNAEIREMNDEYERFTPVKDIVKNFTFIRFHEDIKDIIPSDIVSQIFHDINANKLKFKFRFTCKLIPFDYVCKPHMSDFIKCVLPILKEYFKEGLCVQNNLTYSDLNKLVTIPKDVQDENDEESEEVEKETIKEENHVKKEEKEKQKNLKEKGCNKLSWALIYRRTNTQALNRNEILTILDNCIGSNYSVNLTNPDLAIIVHINEIVCGISIIKNYGKTRKFNIASFKEDE